MGSLKVLVVEDEFPTARTITYLLTRNGHRCRVARDGVEALEKIAEEKPDLLLLDLHMPRMDGLETCRRIRASEETKGIYIIVLTALGEDDNLPKAMEAGADEYMAKPLDPRKVLERVGAVFRGAHSR